MKCAEVRKFVRLYLDSELDTEHSFEVERHLESCAECAGLFDAEKKFGDRLAKFLRHGPATRSLWENIESQISPARQAKLKALWPVALAASLIIAAGVGFFTKSRSLDLANAVEECHSAFVHQLTTPEFNGPVPDKIAQQFSGRLDTAAFAYLPSRTTFSSSGARLCHVEGVPVALILGHCAETPVSMIVLKKSELEHFPTMKQRLESGDPIVCGHSGRYQFAARFIDDYVVCLVGDTPRPVLEDLLKTVRRADG
ncbi:MAG TPA: zf-HC2 domain-containing protein [Chthoniobacterales bacterium]|nr:zf-HC2 domain-containing protein [Chthoniobacterales bacterium]